MAFFSRPQSNAVRIARPDTQDEPKHQFQARKDSVQRQCRNIVIYGHCKFQDKGCIYYHPQTTSDTQTNPPRSESPATSLSAQAINAPVFVPKASGASSPPIATTLHQSPITTYSTLSSPENVSNDNHQNHESYDMYNYQSGDMGVEGITGTLDPHYYDDNPYYQPEYDPNVMNAAYFATSQVYMRQPLDYHLYTPAMPADFVASHTNTHFVPPTNELRQTLQRRSEAIRSIAPQGITLPEELQGYHTLVPLESISSNVERRKFGNWYSTVYRAIRTSDGMPYVLRRIENYRLMHQAAFVAIEKWSSIRHPSIVSVREAFTTRSFGDNSLVVAYACHSNAQTLYDTHFKSKSAAYQPHQHGRIQTQSQSHIIPERTIWSYIVQIASAIKKVHDHGQAVRMIDVTKILVTGQNRVRIGSCGIIDVLMYETHQDLLYLQQEDLMMFGRLIFALCCNNVSASGQKSLDFMAKYYSAEVKNVALFLLSKGGPPKNIDQLLSMIHSKVLAEQEEALIATDRLEHELLSELENARLVRLLCKFGFINERPEFAREPRWSETGDRYIIKLFRDYVFHQVDEHGNPVVNLSHVLTCLNKLDAGTDEQVMLIARDEQSCLVVSYREIKACIDGAFNELARASTMASSAQGYKGR